MEQPTKLFNIDNVEEQVAKLNKKIIAPYSSSTYSTIGGVTNISILINISMDSKSDWPGGMLVNSRYAKFHLSNKGGLEMFSGNTKKSMRKTICSSVDEAISKINKYLSSPERYEDGGEIEVAGKQNVYPSASRSGFALKTVVPTSMHSELKMFNEYLRTYIAEEYNMTVVQYVAQKLHYETVEDLFADPVKLDDMGNPKGRFAIEQIDGIATAIFNYEVNRDSIIIADQTGVGKGRTAAGLIRYAILELGKVPFFVTEKKHLIIDIYRDLVDIGFDANIPEVIVTKSEPIKKESYKRSEIIKEIKKDLNEKEDISVEYELPQEEEYVEGKIVPTWFSINKLKSFPNRKSMGLDDDTEENDTIFEEYEIIFNNLIELYEQKMIEEGVVKVTTTTVSQESMQRLEEEAKKQGKMRLRPFFPNEMNVTDKDGNILYKKMTNEEIKKIYGYTKDSEGKMVYNWANPPESKTLELPSEYKIIALPYTQIRATFEKPKEMGGRVFQSPKKRFFEAIAEGITSRQDGNSAVLILDESHNAAGGSATFDNVSKLIELSSMTTFLSATYAKRPDNMPLYAQGNSLKESGLSKSQMTDVFKKGEVALQEAVSAELTRNGQILRREKKIVGKTDYFYVYDDETEYNGSRIGTKQRLMLDDVSETFGEILNFQNNILRAIKKEKDLRPTREENDDELIGSKEEIKKAMTIKALTFQMFNFFLVGIKLEQLEYELKNKITNGRKAVITIANTMEAALKDMPKSFMTNKDDDKYKIGDSIENDFKLYLAYLLFYTMRFNLKREVPNEKGVIETVDETICVFDSTNEFAYKILSKFEQPYKELLNKILNTNTKIPIAPIDVIKSMVNGFVDSDGYEHNIEELTGRSLCLTFPDKNNLSVGVISRRKARPTTEVVKDFNSNVIDHLIINKSGATGISMHPVKLGQAQVVLPTEIVLEDGETDEDKGIEIGFPLKLANKTEVKKRAMIILQMELDINVEVQKLGRISRTGQVYRPEYTYIVSSIPSEGRLTAMMEKKLRSLSANVSSNQEQSSDLFSADDFFSDVAVIPFIEALKDIGDSTASGNEQNINKEFIKEYTKLLYFKPFEEQLDFYNSFALRLKAHIKYLESLGGYVGRMDKKDYKTSTLEEYPFYIGNENAKTSFGRHATITKVMADVPVKKKNELDITERLRNNYNSDSFYIGFDYIPKGSLENIEQYKAKLSESVRNYSESNISELKESVKEHNFDIETRQNTIATFIDEMRSLSKINVSEISQVFIDIVTAEKEFADIEVTYQKAVDERQFEKATELAKPYDELKAKVDFLREKKRNFIESIGSNAPEELDKYIPKKIDSIGKNIQRERRGIATSEDKIDEINQKIKYQYALLNKILFMIQSIGAVVDYVNYKETPINGIVVHSKKNVYDEVYSAEVEEVVGYDYALNINEKAVVTEINIDGRNLNPSSIKVEVVTLSNCISEIPFSKIFPNFNDNQKSLGMKAENKFTPFNDTYVDFWDKEILMKSPSLTRDVKWVVNGNILRGFKGVIDMRLLPLIVKYTTIERADKIGIEINNVKDSNDTTIDTYKNLEKAYNLNHNVIVFDCNVENFNTLLKGFLYDEYVGAYYNASRGDEDAMAAIKDKRVYKKYLFQIAERLKLSFLVVEAQETLMDYSKALRSAISYGDGMSDIPMMSEDEFMSYLKVEIVSENIYVTDAFDMAISQTSSRYNYEYVVTSGSGLRENSILDAANKFNYQNIQQGYHQNVLYINREQIEPFISNSGHLEVKACAIKNLDFIHLVKAIEYMEKINAKPTLSVFPSYFEKVKDNYNFGDSFQTAIASSTTKNLTEAEISNMIDELLTTLN
jgi:hypothetical protein